MESLRLGMCSFLPPCHPQGDKVLKNARWFNSQEDRQGFLKQTNMYDYNNKINEKQVKETVPIWSQKLTLPCNNLIPDTQIKVFMRTFQRLTHLLINCCIVLELWMMQI